ncbi:MAG: prolipoprotein diacylglyceryl transferase [Treponema sp.]|jgi:phosphatidylglycerol:prolipoprotein diacylglycerol transferase|nr:prolipoprotein diacylglyceryl transferase [Treponema sp.]
MPFLSINFPSWLKPEIIPGLPLRWYGLMYIFAFATAFLLYRKQVKERNFPMTSDNLTSLFFWGILGLLLGARLFSTLIYDSTGIYAREPWLIFWPFRNGQFTGLQGMSYHGGAFGGLLAVIIYAKAKKVSFREIGDMFAAAIPLGFTFGRLGNFINGELYGRVTTVPWGMIFPASGDGLPRHPSQLYQALFEGIVLWLLIWFFRNRKPFKGFLVGLYFLGYGFIRFIIEYFREPDVDLGFRIVIGNNPILSFTTGQILCLWMIAFGIVWLLIASRLPDRKPIRIYADEHTRLHINKEDAAKERNKRRKMRKKLK